MSDPPRLDDPRSASPASLVTLIRAGRADLPDAARMRALEESLGFGAGALPAGAGAAKGAAIGVGGAAKFAGVAILVVGAGAGVAASRSLSKVLPTNVTAPSALARAAPSSLPFRLDPAVTAVTLSSSEPLSPATHAAPTPVTGGPFAGATATSNAMNARRDGAIGRAPPAVSVAFPGAMEAASGSPAAPLRADTEFSLLEQAQEEVRDAPQRALELTDRDARLFPSGVLAQERDVIAIDALVRLHRIDDARARASQFFRAFPGSAHGPRITALLGSDADLHNR